MTDVLHLGSSLHPSDFTVAIEYYKLENWVFNCITLNPQMLRYQLYDAPTRPQCHEKESLLVELQREPFIDSEYETRIDKLECDTDAWGKEEEWTAKQTDQFVSHYLITPVRDNGKTDLGLQFESLIEQREKGRTDPFCGPNYDMQADTMSPYIPPQRAEQHPIMGTGHLALAMQRATMHTHTPPNSPGLHSFARTRQEFINGLNSLLVAPLYGFDTTMFIIHPIELFDDG
ncbi:MAG: hypothetical protein GY737_14650, partial [Desulfobacteraceae bacterium]|nr:hypothetical protein [Desulfobacteraceae bacterium]